jgi:hypothetical protein
MQSVLGDVTTGQLGLNVRTNLGDPLGPRRRQRLKHHVSLGSTAAAATAETLIRRTLGG